MYDIFAELLKEKGVTPYQVYKATGVAQSSLSDWKNGKSKPKYEKMVKIADYFGVSVDHLMGLTEYESNPARFNAHLSYMRFLDFISNDPTASFGDRFSFLVDHSEFDLDAHSFAFHFGIGEDVVISWMEGSSFPFNDMLDKISRYFSVSIDELLGKKDMQIYMQRRATEKSIPAALGELTFDDFTYAMYNEGQELTEENKKKLLEMAKFFKMQQDKEKG